MDRIFPMDEVHKGGSKCSVNGCNNYFSQCRNKLQFFRFPNPKDSFQDERSNKWKIVCNSEKLMRFSSVSLNNNYRVCSIHFSPEDITKGRLKKDAVPRFHLYPNLQVPSKQTNGEYRFDSKNIAEILPDNLTKVDKETQTEYSFTEMSTQANIILITEAQKKRKIQDTIKEQLGDTKNIHSLQFKNAEIMSKDAFKRACDVYLPKNMAKLAKTMADIKQL